MSERPFERILIPVDFSPCSDAALRMALTLARTYQATVEVLHVIDTQVLEALNRAGLAPQTEAAAQVKRLRHQARVNLRRMLAAADTAGVDVRRIVAEGIPYVEIGKHAREGQAGLVVMGSYGGTVGSVDKLFFGSTAEKVVRTVGRPVLTVPLPVISQGRAGIPNTKERT